MSHRGMLRCAVTGAVVVLVAGCSTSGPDVASDKIDDVADAYVDRIDRFVRTDTPGQDLAALLDGFEEGTQAPTSNSAIRVDPLSWDGSSGQEGGAVIEARLTASVPAYDSADWFGTSYDAATRTRCLRFTVRSFDHRTDVDDIDCPDGPVPPPPSRVPVAQVPADAEGRVAKVFRSATPSSLEADTAAAFSAEGLLVATAVDGGRLIVTVGAERSDACFVAVRERDGTVTFPSGFPREWLMPGEVGCKPELITNPPV